MASLHRKGTPDAITQAGINVLERRRAYRLSSLVTGDGEQVGVIGNQDGPRVMWAWRRTSNATQCALPNRHSSLNGPIAIIGTSLLLASIY